MSSYQHFDARSDDGVVVLRLANPGSYDTVDYGDLQTELLRFAEETRPRLLVVDFSNVAYCSTAVINALMQVRKRLAEHEGGLRLSGLSAEVREAFQHLRLDGTVFRIYDTAEAAASEA
jgi:anti-anti-sigma factor